MSTHQHPADTTCLACAARRRPFTVVDVAGDDVLGERLRSAGIWRDAVVEVVGQAPFGDPLLVEMHGFRIALRRNEAERVTVKAVEPKP